jgi:hypothetical protein
MLDEVRRRAKALDILHFHMDLMHFPAFRDIAAHTLTTLHGRLDLLLRLSLANLAADQGAERRTRHAYPTADIKPGAQEIL